MYPYAALLALGLATSATAQNVPLGGWALPEGTVVESVVALDAQTEWAMTDGQGDVAAFTKYDTMRDTVRTVVTEVVGGALQALTESHVGGERRSRHVVGARTVRDDREPVVGVGHPVRVERSGAGWRYTPTTDAPPDALLAFLDEMQDVAPDYVFNPALERSARVGESWDVPVGVQMQMRPGLLRDREQRYRVRLDSVGTWGGYRVAFLSTETDQVTSFGEGTQRVRGRGRYVRRLDVRVNVVADVEQAVEAEAPGTFSDGSPFRAVLSGTRRFRVVQTVRTPAD